MNGNQDWSQPATETANHAHVDNTVNVGGLPIDREALQGFVKEVKSYLPKIQAGIVTFYQNPAAMEQLAEAHGYLHMIKQAAAVVGLTALNNIAIKKEELLERIAMGGLMLDEPLAAAFCNVLNHLNGYLDQVPLGVSVLPPGLINSLQLLDQAADRFRAPNVPVYSFESFAPAPPSAPLPVFVLSELFDEAPAIQINNPAESVVAPEPIVEPAPMTPVITATPFLQDEATVADEPVAAPASNPVTAISEFPTPAIVAAQAVAQPELANWENQPFAATASSAPEAELTGGSTSPEPAAAFTFTPDTVTTPAPLEFISPALPAPNELFADFAQPIDTTYVDHAAPVTAAPAIDDVLFDHPATQVAPAVAADLHSPESARWQDTLPLTSTVNAEATNLAPSAESAPESMAAPIVVPQDTHELPLVTEFAPAQPLAEQYSAPVEADQIWPVPYEPVHVTAELNWPDTPAINEFATRAQETVTDNGPTVAPHLESEIPALEFCRDTAELPRLEEVYAALGEPVPASETTQAAIFAPTASALEPVELAAADVVTDAFSPEAPGVSSTSHEVIAAAFDNDDSAISSMHPIDIVDIDEAANATEFVSSSEPTQVMQVAAPDLQFESPVAQPSVEPNSITFAPASETPFAARLESDDQSFDLRAPFSALPQAAAAIEHSLAIDHDVPVEFTAVTNDNLNQVIEPAALETARSFDAPTVLEEDSFNQLAKLNELMQAQALAPATAAQTAPVSNSSAWFTPAEATDFHLATPTVTTNPVDEITTAMAPLAAADQAAESVSEPIELTVQPAAAPALVHSEHKLPALWERFALPTQPATEETASQAQVLENELATTSSFLLTAAAPAAPTDSEAIINAARQPDANEIQLVEPTVAQAIQATVAFSETFAAPVNEPATPAEIGDLFVDKPQMASTAADSEQPQPERYTKHYNDVEPLLLNYDKALAQLPSIWDHAAQATPSVNEVADHDAVAQTQPAEPLMQFVKDEELEPARTTDTFGWAFEPVASERPSEQPGAFFEPTTAVQPFTETATNAPAAKLSESAETLATVPVITVQTSAPEASVNPSSLNEASRLAEIGALSIYGAPAELAAPAVQLTENAATSELTELVEIAVSSDLSEAHSGSATHNDWLATMQAELVALKQLNQPPVGALDPVDFTPAPPALMVSASSDASAVADATPLLVAAEPAPTTDMLWQTGSFKPTQATDLVADNLTIDNVSAAATPAVTESEPVTPSPSWAALTPFPAGQSVTTDELSERQAPASEMVEPNQSGQNLWATDFTQTALAHPAPISPALLADAKSQPDPFAEDFAVDEALLSAHADSDFEDADFSFAPSTQAASQSRYEYDDSWDVPAELLEVFQPEAEEHLRIITLSLPALAKQPDNQSLLQEIRRSSHSLKGSSAVVGFYGITKLAHRMEDLLDLLYEGEMQMNPAILQLLFASTEALENLLNQRTEPEAIHVLYAEYDQLLNVAPATAASDHEAAPFNEQAADALTDTPQLAAQLAGFAQANQSALDAQLAARELVMQATEQVGVTETATPAPSENIALVLAQASALTSNESNTASLAPLDDIHLGTVSGSTASNEAPEQTPATPLTARGNYVRVPIERLDSVVKMITELMVARATFEQSMGELNRQLEELRGNATRLTRVASRMEVQFEASTLGTGLGAVTGAQAANQPFSLGNGAALPNYGQPLGQSIASMLSPVLNKNNYGFDALEFDQYTEFHLLLRELTECTGDMQTLEHELTAIGELFEGTLRRQGRLTNDMQDQVMRLRMVPLGTLASRLHRTAHQVAAQLGKVVNFVLDGEDTRLDKTVIEEMTDPLLHLLRNAIDHGIEAPSVRQQFGKPASGTIRLRAYHEGTQTVIQITDDGAGLSLEKLRASAVRNALISNIDAARLTEEELYQLIFLPGFSTTTSVSEISGRGVGMDVVKSTIQRLKGRIDLESKRGKGTQFTIRLPMTLAVMRALLVKTIKQTYAIPPLGLQQIVKLTPNLLDKVGEQPVVRVNDKIYPLFQLSRLLGYQRPNEAFSQAQLGLLLTLDDHNIAVAVDETLGGRDIVVKSLGNHLRQVHGITGATLMGDGSTVLILNLIELVRETIRPQSALAAKLKANAVARQRQTPQAPAERRNKQLCIMVVDDSLSVRRVLSNRLLNEGWKALQAKDGLDALEQLQQSTALPDAILLDIEMPRMDGYEFIAAIRKSDTYCDIPIIMITSRAGQKHRDRAFEAGANEYLVKPYQDEQLLKLIRTLTKQEEAATLSNEIE